MKAENSAFVFSVALGNFPQVAEVLDAGTIKITMETSPGKKSFCLRRQRKWRWNSKEPKAISGQIFTQEFGIRGILAKLMFLCLSVVYLCICVNMRLYCAVSSWSAFVWQWVLEVAGVSCWRRAACLVTCWSLRRAVWSILQQVPPKLCCLPPQQSGQTLWRASLKGSHSLCSAGCWSFVCVDWIISESFSF